MLNVRQILVIALGLSALGVGLTGCGLKGPLHLPTEPAAANRATLPSLLLPSSGTTSAPVLPPSAASSAPRPAGAAQ